MQKLLQDIRQCRTCLAHLSHGVRPVVQASESSKILIIGQAPGRKVHETGVPWNDPSGDQLRTWLDVDKEQFYNSALMALMPMGFCYPGKGKNGDLPPRIECAPQWHAALLAKMPQVKVTLLVGMYAQHQYLVGGYRTLTENVRNHSDFAPQFLPLPHPSPRNRIWQKNNPWFIDEVIPILQHKVKKVLVI